MANCRSVVKHYENMNLQQLTDLWNQFYKKGPTIEVLREILMYYIHHKNFPPLMQNSCDTLLASVDLKHVSKKLKNTAFQIMEEVSACLEGSIVDQVTFASQRNNHTSMLNCVLVGGFVSLLDEGTVEKLLSFLKNPEVPIEERAKLLLCLLVILETYPALISSENVSRLGVLMESWFRHSQSKSVSSSGTLFSRSDTVTAIEVDGSYAGEVFTLLTLANNFSDHHLMGIHCFSTIREWLGKKVFRQNRKLTESLREYCSLVVEQCFRPARKEHDLALQKAVLCEVVEIMNQLVQLDSAHGPHCLIIVKRIQNNIREHFKGDYRDVCVFVKVLSFLLNFGESTGYNSQLVCEYFLQDMVYRSYTSGLAAVEMVVFLVENRHKIIALEQPLLQRFFPNILKIVACHPCVVIEEFIELVRDLISPTTAVEVLHSLLDLPLLAASLCLHQAPVLVRSDGAGAMDSEWAALLGLARAEFQQAFSYVLRVESGQEIAPEKMSAYMKFLQKMSNHNLVITCSQIVPLLLDSYFREVEKWKEVASIAPVVLHMFSRLLVIYDVPGYAPSVKRCLLRHFKQLFKACPRLIFLLQNKIIEYISTTKNYEMFPLLYIHIIYVVGEYSLSCDWEKQEQNAQIQQYYEAVECLIYEILALFATSESVCLQLLNVASSTLGKLASKCQDQIPRATLCLNKIRMQFSSGLSSHPSKQQLIVRDRVEELLCVLQNPNVANMVWSSLSCNTSVTSYVQVLSHVTDS